jgi:hypothetical protein
LIDGQVLDGGGLARVHQYDVEDVGLGPIIQGALQVVGWFLELA